MCLWFVVVMYTQVKRQDTPYDAGWTPRPPPLNRMGSFGRRPYFRPNVRPWPGQTGRRQGPMMSDYSYQAPRQNSGRRRPGGRGGSADPTGDLYSSSYEDVGQGPYADYLQPYEYDEEWMSNHQLPYDDGKTGSDEATDHNGRPKFSSPTTTVSADSGDCKLCWLLMFLV